MATVFFYLHIFTESVRRILLVAPVDTLYRTSIVSFSTVLPLNLFVNLSLAPLSLFLTYGANLGVWPDCWVSAEFPRVPISRKGSGDTTITIHLYSPRSLGQETAKKPFGLRLKLPPAQLSTTYDGGFTLSLFIADHQVQKL